MTLTWKKQEIRTNKAVQKKQTLIHIMRASKWCLSKCLNTFENTRHITRGI
jgi:hypothetical protein